LNVCTDILYIPTMKEYSYTDTRQRLKTVIAEATTNHEVIRITNRNDRNVILIDEEDYNSLLETAYLLRSPRNAQRLLVAKKRSSSAGLDFEVAITQLDL